ncbi:sensor domain-containing protein [Marinimicrobium sp. C2-29]|uniref:sensor domain-containing protein n=1 Tax=Marinimicrobium sp. C2-29 TaxID=3139825 RepID=UPI00313A41E5
MAAEEVFRQLADSLAFNNSPDFFSDLVARLARILAVDHVLISEVLDDRGRVRTLANWSEGQLRDNLSYSLAGTPCEKVVAAKPCFYPSGVSQIFPEDELLQLIGVEGYLGLPMLALDGTPVGLLAIMSNAPLSLPSVGEEVLRIAAAQAGSELGRRRAEKSLVESERRLHTLMNHLPGMAYRCRNDQYWTMEFVSQGAQELTGYRPEELEGNRRVAYVELIHPADRDRVFDQVQASVVIGKPYHCIYRLVTATGQIRWVWEQGQSVTDVDTGDVLLEGFICDITEQHESERVQEAVIQTATAITSRLGDDYFPQLVQHLTRALNADVGLIATFYNEDSLETQALVVAGEVADNIRYTLADTPCHEVIEQGECVGHFDPPRSIPRPGKGEPLLVHSYVGRRLDSASGEPIGSLTVLYCNPAPDLKLATSVLRILAAGAAAELERQSNDRRIQQLAYVDGTTGLPNRIRFMDWLNEELPRSEGRGSALGLIFLDLKRFKEINDVLGHDIGDQLLAAVAMRLDQSRRPEEFLARLSGDEFAFALPDLGRGDLPRAIERFRVAFAAPIWAAGRDFKLAVNLGAAQFPQDARSAADLFQCASVAIHQAKRSDDGACVFDIAMAETLNHRRALAERLAEALRDDLLLLHFQPVMDLASETLIGAEVLCRWYDEQWGWVSPAQFIPLAEERGLIIDLGDWVLRTAALQLQTWQAQGLVFPGRLSINISAQQFGDPGLADRVALLTRGVEPHFIGLELTESGFMRDPDGAVGITERLRSAGYVLSIDDFGTGYSSLSYLRRFAADTLKIDMSFVRDMLENSHDYTIVTTIVAMAHSLGMTTVAEGVESREQADALARLGCDRVQGFYYGRPLDGDAFAERWLADEEPPRS